MDKSAPSKWASEKARKFYPCVGPACEAGECSGCEKRHELALEFDAIARERDEVTEKKLILEIRIDTAKKMAHSWLGDYKWRREPAGRQVNHVENCADCQYLNDLEHQLDVLKGMTNKPTDLQAALRKACEEATIECHPSNTSSCVVLTGTEVARIFERHLTPVFDALRERDEVTEKLERELEKAKGQLDIILRECQGDDDASLANDYGGTGWEKEVPVATVRWHRNRWKKSNEAAENLAAEVEQYAERKGEAWRVGEGTEIMDALTAYERMGR